MRLESYEIVMKWISASLAREWRFALDSLSSDLCWHIVTEPKREPWGGSHPGIPECACTRSSARFLRVFDPTKEKKHIKRLT
jgi:hypothetical protein